MIMEFIRNINPDETEIILWLVLLLPWVIFFIFVDKKRIKTLLNVGLLTALLAMIGDTIGSGMMLWIYPMKLLPIFYNFFPVDLSFLPVENMLTVQFMPDNKIKRAALILGVSIATVAIESLFEGNTATIFYPHWKPIYSMPAYIFLLYISYFYHNWLSKDKCVDSKQQDN